MPESFEPCGEEVYISDPDDPIVGWYLTFTDEDRFLGGAVIESTSGWLPDVVAEAWRLRANPGGAVMGRPIIRSVLEENCPTVLRNRLLSLDEMKSFGWFSDDDDEDEDEDEPLTAWYPPTLDDEDKVTGFVFAKHRASNFSSLYFGPFTTTEEYVSWLDQHREVGNVLVIPLYLDVDWTR